MAQGKRHWVMRPQPGTRIWSGSYWTTEPIPTQKIHGTAHGKAGPLSTMQQLTDRRGLWLCCFRTELIRIRWLRHGDGATRIEKIIRLCSWLQLLETEKLSNFCSPTEPTRTWPDLTVRLPC